MKIKLFEEYNNNQIVPKYKVGDNVYYKGMHQDKHGLYRVASFNYSEQLHIWRYNLYNLKTKNLLWGAWEKSLSHIDKKREEEIKKREEEIKKREEELRMKMMDVDPYGEENWDEN